MRKVLKNRTYLYLTEFFSGMAVMAVELGASRLLAPYFSSSQIVWTIIIATIMIAMALGNLYGGVRADKDPNPDRLYRRLLIASVWIAFIPAAGKYVILGITGLLVITVSQNLLIIASFLACMVIFVFPCFLLGTCTPSLARYVTGEGGGEVGAVVGRLGAFNTIGSIIGTFLPTFVTIPAVGTAVTFLIFAGILLAIALIYFLSGTDGGQGKGRAGLIISVLLFVTASVFAVRDGFAFWERDLLYEGESVYNYLQVKDTPDSTILSTNVLFGVQSVTMKTDGLTGMYYDYAMAAPVLAKKRERMLILGMGTGTYARQCLRYFGDMEITGVEIDDKITALSHRYFDAPEEAQVLTYDGRAFLAGDSGAYDVIMVDAYQDITIPFQMSSVEFFRAVRDHLAEGGVLVVNMNMKTAAKDGICAYLTDTIADVFPYLRTVDVPGSTNRELFASCDDVFGEAFSKNISQMADPALRDLMAKTAERLCVPESGGRILTDDRAPVELLGMRAIDDIIKEELVYYKEIFRRYGLSGLLGQV